MVQPQAIFAHGEEEQGEKEATEEMSIRDIKASMQLDEEMATEYIRYDALTGNSVVLGRGNKLPILEPEIVTESGKKIKVFRLSVKDLEFEIVALDGNPVQGPPQVRDTVAVGPGQRVDIILIADNPGVWPFHCHNLLHVANDSVYPGEMLTFIRYVD